ncbi:metallophosphoesterase [Acinetobacter sp.]|uniref:metallophosphoesterase n=1 Tax=Acinetobacter sp. TaxID=472 RepID=UPI003D02A46A
MNYWITTDTHFGHDIITKWAGRPENHERLILKRLKSNVTEKDILIHLGDVSFKNHVYWHELLMEIPTKRKYLLRGNHDKKSIDWYLERGWDFVADMLSLKIYGKIIVFSHMPVIDNGYDLNIHGHFHNSDHRRYEPELVAIENDKQRLIMLEHSYMPVNLKTLISQR